MTESPPAIPDGRPSVFAPVGQTKTHVYIAEQLRREITLGLLLTGDALPPERELAAMFGVARATIQRAVRVLEADGLVTARRGRGGGTFVTAPPVDTASRRRLIPRVRRNRAVIEAAVAFRLAVEPAAASEAADARTTEDLARLRRILERAAQTADDAVFTRLDTQFHLAVAGAAHNQFFAEAVESVRLNLNDAVLLLPESPMWQQRSQREHQRIFAALEEGDAQAARKAVRAHVAHTARSVRALLKVV
jgi:GntR family transcriptional regulator, transcriptional repressor for pyruvate dehydrogenase complex